MARVSIQPVQHDSDRNPVDNEIAHLRGLDIHGLRLQWKSIFGRPAPMHLPRHLLFRILAYKVQADRFGDLDAETVRLLDDIATEAARAKAEKADQPAPKPCIRRKKLTPGMVLVREWDGQHHKVTVATDGFVWNGTTYPSLSKVAFAITGTNWNGPRFFGLRDSTKTKRVSKAKQPGAKSGGSR